MNVREPKAQNRQAQLADNLARVEKRLTVACAAAGRARREVTLVAVSKTWPASDVVLLAELGMGDFGENRDQEAAPKAAAVPGVRWHFVGQLQTNKVRSVAAYAHVVHSLDRIRLVRALGRAVGSTSLEGTARRSLPVLVQVALDGTDPGRGQGRGGVPPPRVPALADAVASMPGLRLGGVMAIAPRELDPSAAFTRLAQVAGRVRSDHPEATWVSAGMSGDLEQAVLAGATHVRIGTALFGDRPPHLR